MTERCCLRPMTDADFPALCRYLQDPGVMYAWGHAFSDREVWDWLRRQQARYVVPGYGALAVAFAVTKVRGRNACISRIWKGVYGESTD